jgi:hypothetical protein
MSFEIPVFAFAFEFHNLALFMGWTLAILIGAFALAIIYKIVKGDIDLRYLIAGNDGDASLSRFQFLIFTFVIALSLFLIIVNQPNGPAFPDIPNSILALLGISGGSYVVSKGVDANAPPTTTETTVIPNPPPLPPTTKTVTSEAASVD